MSVIDLFSKRRKRERGEFPDVYQYGEIPNALRVQVTHIWRSAFGDEEFGGVPELFQEIHDALCREYGLFTLTDRRETFFEKVANFMLGASEAEKVLDVIELTFSCLGAVRDRRYEFNPKQSPDDAISELNARFQEHGVGYQFESGQIIRVDSELIHAEVVKPALRFLSRKHFQGAREEYLSAHEHYRHRRFKECLNDCLKAFESTMKSVCLKRKWAHKPTDTAKALLDVLFQESLIPPFMLTHFTGLRSTLEAGVPTVRNKLGGHGQGAVPVDVPEFVAAYALHLTATNILFLVKADEALK